MFQHACALCRHTRGRFERTHGGIFFECTRVFFQRFTPHHNTRHNTTRRQTETDRDRQRQTETEKEDRDRGRRGDEREDDKTRAERREKSEEREDSFSVWWCMAVFYWSSDFPVNSVCARDLSLLNSVQKNSSLISVPFGRLTVFFKFLRISFSTQLQFSFF